MNQEKFERLWGQVVAKAWSDEAFKKRLLKDPSAILSEHGLELPSGTKVNVVENTDTIHNLVLPSKPKEGELTDADLNAVGGGWFGCFCFVATKAPTKGKEKTYDFSGDT